VLPKSQEATRGAEENLRYIVVKPALIFPVALLACSFIARATTASSTSPEVAGVERKLNHIEANSRLAHPDQSPTILTEQEINAYLASDQITFPDGVESVTLEGQAGIITGHARIDFDRVRAGIHSSNPLLAVFTGVHQVEVITHAHGSGHKGYVHVDSVSLDGIEVPQFALELFVEKYIQPRVPEAGMDSIFALPDKIDVATVGEHTLTMTQK
jgi:hypothetical protein